MSKTLATEVLRRCVYDTQVGASTGMTNRGQRVMKAELVISSTYLSYCTYTPPRYVLGQDCDVQRLSKKSVLFSLRIQDVCYY